MDHRRAAMLWRVAVESRLRRQGLIFGSAKPKPKSVNQFSEKIGLIITFAAYCLWIMAASRTIFARRRVAVSRDTP